MLIQHAFPKMLLVLFLLAMQTPSMAMSSSCQAGPPAASDAHTIDYSALNKILTATDNQLRLTQLPLWLAHLADNPSPEAQQLKYHLQLRLAKAQLLSHQEEATLTTLQNFPSTLLLSPQAAELMLQAAIQNHDHLKTRQWALVLADNFPQAIQTPEALLLAAEREPEIRLRIELLQRLIQIANPALAQLKEWQPFDASKSSNAVVILAPYLGNAIQDLRLLRGERDYQRTAHLARCLNDFMQESRPTDSPNLVHDIEKTISAIAHEIPAIEIRLQYLITQLQQQTSQYKICLRQEGDCALRLSDKNRTGRFITLLRNQLGVLKQKLIILEAEKISLARKRSYEMSQLAFLTEEADHVNQLSEEKFNALLESKISENIIDREQTLAMAYFRLAEAQEIVMRNKASL